MQKFDSTTPAGRPRLSVEFRGCFRRASLSLRRALPSKCMRSRLRTPDAVDRLDGAPVVSPDHTTVSQWFHQGVEDVDYVLTFIATFSDGQIEPVEVELPVRRFICIREEIIMQSILSVLDGKKT
jgi:hypothetical protein